MRRPLVLIVLLAAWGYGAPAVLAGPAASQNNEGNRFYERKRLDEALKKYTDAQVTLPNAPELHYNIGNVLFRKGEIDKAIEEYLKAQSAKDPRLSQAATYNRGNALMSSGKAQDAVNAYVQALRARPDDADAKRNLELALRLLQEKQKQQQKQPDRQDEKQPPPKTPPESGPPKGGDEPKKPAAQKGQAPMSEEEARRILEALQDQEKEGIKQHVQAAVPGDRRPPEEDW